MNVQGSERAYDLVRADRADLGRSVIARYAPVVVDLDVPGEVTIMNATAEDSVVVRLTGGPIGARPGRPAPPPRPSSARSAILAGGLHDVPVPPYGSLTLVVVADSS